MRFQSKNYMYTLMYMLDMRDSKERAICIDKCLCLICKIPQKELDGVLGRHLCVMVPVFELSRYIYYNYVFLVYTKSYILYVYLYLCFIILPYSMLL